MAATQIQQNESVGLNEIGVISANNAGTLADLENVLAQKAEAAGAKSFLITSATGNNKIHGTAVIYR
ncbi:Multiple stress resistance protein BhsA precursor [Yersinia pekkanenii]|uniref:Multiple stress resistance protein BhsA n=1 Tax=Yersinia pekkanenii TaxID=1288385 RepID=A0A0T9NHK3_9GAMM|nr:DUF1471 domain-containing protein [Yersinia pekkanenii]CNH09607.1 Multiple stress resistance protein BhsA precursor [Yersinia pekkanenii]CRY64723.1 Multiple stress resistance protein BhsA precursor [Yersinia pekkanenii]